MSTARSPRYHETAHQRWAAWVEESRSVEGFHRALGAMDRVADAASHHAPDTPLFHDPGTEAHIRLVEPERAAELLRSQRRNRRAVAAVQRRRAARRHAASNGASSSAPPDIAALADPQDADAVAVLRRALLRLPSLGMDDWTAAGHALREIREAGGTSLAGAHAATKLSVRQLTALEAGEPDVLPGRFFAESYLRVYAGFLGIGAIRRGEDDAATRSGRPCLVFDAAERPAEDRELALPRAGTRVVRPGSLRPRRGRRAAAAAVALVAIGAIGIAAVVDARGSQASSRSHRVPSPARPATTVARPRARPVDTQSIAALEPVAHDASGAQFAVGPAPVTLVLVAHGPCWVQVRNGAGGPVLFEGMLAEQQPRTFSSPGALWVRLGSPTNVALTVGGRPVGLAVAPGTPYDITLRSS
ncbi:MAG: helix-turn-helix domain-containing protein [Acidimicrobiia bacterium]